MLKDLSIVKRTKENIILYTFVFKNGGWWLKVTDIDTLMEFHDKTDHTIFGDAYLFNLDSKQGQNKALHSTYRKSESLDKAINLIGENRNLSYIQSANYLMTTIVRQQAELIQEVGGIYINPFGGYHGIESTPTNYTYYQTDKLVYPHFKKEHIKISQFPGGDHYYARVGTIEVKDENGIKWNTYEEAYQKALELVG